MLALAAANIGFWLLAATAIRDHPRFLAPSFLAWTFGLRHALDADHIAAIDLVTRRLMARARRPILVGLFFSIGHSSVVMLASLVLLLVPVHSWLDRVHDVGGLIGTSVSILFLSIMAASNMLSFRAQWRAGPSGRAPSGPAGVMTRLLAPMTDLIRHDSQMIPLGFLFGLGFDTATEIGLLGLTASEATHGLSAIHIMLLPLLFAAGMALMDSLDTVLMVRAWSWSSASAERRALYIRAVTAFSALAAACVAAIELLQLVGGNEPMPPLLRALAARAADHFQIVGIGLVMGFLGLWAIAALLATPRQPAFTDRPDR
ncbi:high-affinity nickel permease [Gluconacetobacter sacchari DSM 12717]|nr:high-affinity nickel permease [Gluconacetobacter sacchari DSM 12717]